MPEISYNQLREAHMNAEAERVALAYTRPITPFRITPTISEELRKIAIQVEKEDNCKLALSKQVTIKVRCPKCKRMVKQVGGQILSHRRQENCLGSGMGDWCVNNFSL